MGRMTGEVHQRFISGLHIRLHLSMCTQTHIACIYSTHTCTRARVHTHLKQQRNTWKMKKEPKKRNVKGKVCKITKYNREVKSGKDTPGLGNSLPWRTTFSAKWAHRLLSEWEVNMKTTISDNKVEREAARARRIEADSFYFLLFFF